jgi:aminomethyltransferase
MANRTILHDSHVRLGARMVDFGGWDMPVQYDGILAEHHRTRQDVSMFDTCHMDAFCVEGPGSQDFLSRLVTQDLRSLADGRCRYGFLLRDDGGVLDDLIVYRFAADRWMAVVNAGTAPGDFAWFHSHAPAVGVALQDLRGIQGKIDVQGPNSSRPVEAFLGINLADMKYFSFRTFTVDGVAGVVSRTGYTGEHGYEIYAPVATILTFWERLLALGVKPAGLGARDTLRLEAGLPLYGHELSTEVSPAEAGMTKYAAKNEEFIGRAAFLARQAGGVARRLVGFKIAGRQSARNGNRVLDSAGAAAGHVTSGSFAPTLGYAIGCAYVQPDLAAPDTALTIDMGSRQLEARVSPLPFYRRK